MSEPKFKVGDRVKITEKNSSNSIRFGGREAVIDHEGKRDRYTENIFYGVDLDPGYDGIWEDELTLIVRAQDLKEGDLVNLTGGAWYLDEKQAGPYVVEIRNGIPTVPIDESGYCSLHDDNDWGFEFVSHAPEQKLPTFPSARINREEGLVITNGVDIEAVIPSDFVSRYFEVEERDGHKALYVELLVNDIAFDSNAKKVD